MFTDSHILSTGSSLYFLKLVRGLDLSIVIFPLLVVINCLLPLDGRIPIILVSLPVVIYFILLLDDCIPVVFVFTTGSDYVI